MRRYRTLTRKLRRKEDDRFKVKHEDVEGNCQHCHWKAVIDISKSQPQRERALATQQSEMRQLNFELIDSVTVLYVMCVVHFIFRTVGRTCESLCTTSDKKSILCDFSPTPMIEKLLSLIRISHRDVIPGELLLFGRINRLFHPKKLEIPLLQCKRLTQKL